MAKLGDIKIAVDLASFFTDPRVSLCKNIECRFNMFCVKPGDGNKNCMFNEIQLSEKGVCQQFEKKEQPKCQQ